MANLRKPAFFGKYRAIVTNNKDPEKRKRIKVKCPKLFSDKETDWAMPALPPHLSDVPDVGQYVWIEFEGGHPDFPIWTGGWDIESTVPEEVVSGYEDSEGEPLTKEFKTKAGYMIELREVEGSGYIKIKTPKGHEVLLDDTDDEEKIQVQDMAGNKVLLNAVSDSEYIEALDKAGNKVRLNAVSGSEYVEVADNGGNRLHLDPVNTKVTLQTSGGHVLEFNDQGPIINVNAPGNVTFSIGANATFQVAGNASVMASGNVVIDGTSIALAGGGPPIARIGDEVQVVVGHGSSAGTHKGTIVAGSPKVTSG